LCHDRLFVYNKKSAEKTTTQKRVLQNKNINNVEDNTDKKEPIGLIAHKQMTHDAISTSIVNYPEIRTVFKLQNETLAPLTSVQNSVAKININNSINQSIYADDSLNDKPGSINKKQIRRGKTFYFGVAAAIDYSNVKSSSVNEAGYAAGVIAGYIFNRAIEIETGLILNKRNYFSEGRYFNMEKVRDVMPPDMHIISLNTTSSVVEIPLKIKYNFIRSAKSTVFATTGMSSYLITSQKNDYNVSMNGVGEQLTAMYHKNEFLLPAVINMSAGYNYIFSNDLNIRVEPFLKIPLKGMGIGNLPVTSAGIQLSVVRKFK
jgi:hypothetical protein